MIDLDEWAFAVGDRVCLQSRPHCVGRIVEKVTNNPVTFTVMVDPCGDDRAYSVACFPQDLKPWGRYYAEVTVTYKSGQQWRFNAQTREEIDEWGKWGARKGTHETITLQIGRSAFILSWEGLETVVITRKQLEIDKEDTWEHAGIIVEQKE